MQCTYRILALAVSLALSQLAQGANMIRMSAPIADKGTWADAPAITSDWTLTGDVYGCSNWTPDPDDVETGETFTQSATDCLQPRQRTVQKRQVNTKTQVAHNVGGLTIEKGTTPETQSRNAVGTMGAWVQAQAQNTDWENVGGIQSCSNWSPATDSVETGTTLTQIATDCQQIQQRTSQAMEQNTATMAFRNVGDAVTQTQSLAETQSRTVEGTLGDWAAAEALTSAWSNTGDVSSCSNWSPATDTVETGTSLTQTATDCKQTQQRTSQAREQNSSTDNFRNVGALAQETQVIAVTQSRESTGSLGVWSTATPITGEWGNVGTIQSCTNWSPATNTVEADTAMTQTATDCQQAQQRSTQAREQNSSTLNYRNVGIVGTESRSLSVTQNRDAVGTLGTWATAASVNSAWTNTSSVQSCSNWSPATSTIETGTSFTQTATNCQQAQQRTSQAREQNSATQNYRNVGALVTQTQSVSVTQTQTSMGTLGTWQTAAALVSAWSNVGSSVNCSNWSPATSTVNQGTAFTQTATDCQQTQQRTSQAREQNTSTLNYRNVGAATTESQVIAASQTRTATGTKAVLTTNLPVNEGSTFTLSIASTVRYGVKNSTRYTDKAFAAGSYACSNGTFGDPANGTVKVCWIP